MVSLVRDFGDALHAAAHITGGGIVGNVVRILPEALDAVIDMTSFTTPEIFFEIQRRGQVSADEMVRVFNCGLGMVVAVDAARAPEILASAQATGIEAMVVGHVTAGTGKVTLV